MDGGNKIVILALTGTGIFGGGERLILRMVHWLHEHDYRVMVMYSKSADIVPELLAKLDKYEAEMVVLQRLKGKREIPNFMNACVECPDNSRVKIICIHSMYNFFAAEMIQHHLPNCRCDVVHYIIHQNDFCRVQVGEPSWPLLMTVYMKFFNRYHRRLIERMEKNGNIAYYLIEAAEHIHATLGFKSIKDKKVNVIRVGMDADVFDEEIIRSKYHNDCFLIVATARLDFPEKGFLLGLVDEFEAVLEKKTNAKLIIIGDGRSKTELEAKVADSSAASSIEMVGEVSYEKLTDYINKANLYISNGSGPLDAARVGVISIVANFFATECLTKGFWCDDPDNLGYHGTILAREMILKTMDMGEEEYLSLARQTYDTFLHYCGMDSFMKQMLAPMNCSEKPLLSRGYLMRAKMMLQCKYYVQRLIG